MNYNDEIISFFITTLSGWDVTGYHSRSLFIIKNRHNFGHSLHAGLFCVADWIGSFEIYFQTFPVQFQHPLTGRIESHI